MYKHLVSATTPIESGLHKQLATHLNSEIALGTINDFVDAMKWMRSTFLYVRGVANPTYYGIQSKCMKTIEHELKDMCLANIRILSDTKLVVIDEYYEIVESSEFGKIMARFFLSLNTMKNFAELCGTESMEDIFNRIVSCNEFVLSFRLRHNEKKLLNEICRKLRTETDSIVLSPKGSVKNLGDKVSCLLQATLSQIDISDPGLKAEAIEINKLAERLSKCLTEYFLAKQFTNNKFKSLISTHLMTKCFQLKTWRFTTAKLSDVPHYNVTVEFLSDEKFIITVVHSERYQNIGEIASFISLVVGDTENNLILHTEDVNFHLEKTGAYEKEMMVKSSTAFIEVYLIDHQQECDLFARVIPAKENRMIAKPYVMSISGSGSKQVVTAINPKPTIRTLTAKAIPTTTAKETMTSPKINKPSAVQTKVNDFFKKPQSSISSHNTILPTEQPNLDPSVRRASHNIIQSSGNANPSNEQKIFNSNKKTQSPFVKPQNSPKILSRRSQLYDFDASFMNTQFSVANEKQKNNGGQRSLKLGYQTKNVPRLEPQTPIISKLFNATGNGNRFVSAKSIFKESRKGISLSVEECFDKFDDECVELPHSLKQNERWAAKNIATCIEANGNVLPKQGKCLEQSIADILNCKVNAIGLNRKYRNEFEMEPMNRNEHTSLPSMRQQLLSNDSNANRGTVSREKPPVILEASFCDTFFTNSTEWSFSPIRMKPTRPVDSPMLERKKQKQKPNFDFNANDIDAIEWNNMGKISNDTIPFSMPLIHRQSDLLNDGPCVDRSIDNPPSENPSMNRYAAAKIATVSNFDEMRRDSRNSEKFWSSAGKDDSPDTSIERKISIIDQLIANRCARDKSDAKNQMKKPCGKMVQARVKRTRHSSILSDTLNRSWDPSFTQQNYSKEERSREYIRRNILRLPRENGAHLGQDAADVNDTMGFDWFSE